MGLKICLLCGFMITYITRILDFFIPDLVMD